MKKFLRLIALGLGLMGVPLLGQAEVKGNFGNVSRAELISPSMKPTRRVAGNFSFAPRNVGSVKVRGFDAEVEYLESNGNQWIDTKIVPNEKTPFRVVFQNDNPSANAPGYGNVLGARKASLNQELQVGQYNNGLVSVGTRNTNMGIHSSDIQEVSFDGINKAVINGTQKNITVSSFSDYVGTIVLFGIRSGGSVQQLQAGRIYRFTWGDKADFVPVRKGTKGYMYDKVSGQLFGNAGTGEFSVGPDLESIAKGYIQDGLFILWDGIENIGWGQHSNDAFCLATSKYYPNDSNQGWMNLVFNKTDLVRLGGYSFSPTGTPNEELQQNGSYKTQGTWTDNSFIVTTAGSFVTPYQYFYALSSNNWTQSALITRPSASALWGIRCGNTYSQKDRLTYSYNNNGTVTQTTTSALLPSELYGEPHELTVAMNGKEAIVRLYLDGVFFAEEILRGKPINRQLIYAFNLSADTVVYNLRYYNRLLSDDEIWHNHLVDKRRFGLP